MGAARREDELRLFWRVRFSAQEVFRLLALLGAALIETFKLFLGNSVTLGWLEGRCDITSLGTRQQPTC